MPHYLMIQHKSKANVELNVFGSVRSPNERILGLAWQLDAPQGIRVQIINRPVDYFYADSVYFIYKCLFLLINLNRGEQTGDL